MTPNRHGSAVIEFPSDLEIVTTREFDAPIELVFDHFVFVTDDGTECSFRGTYLEIERPTLIVDTWLFEGWPDAEAVKTIDLLEADGVTKMRTSLAFRDQAGRDHMTKFDGQEDSWDKMEDYLRSLLDPEGDSADSGTG